MIGFGVEDDRFWGAAIEDDESVLRLRSRLARRRDRDQGRWIWVREGEVERQSRTDSKSNGEVEVEWRTDRPLSLSLSLSLSLLLSLRGGASPSPSALSQFSRKWEFEGKIKTEINLHPLTGQLKSIFKKCIFRAQPITRKYEKAFSKMLFIQNKHKLNNKRGKCNVSSSLFLFRSK